MREWEGEQRRRWGEGRGAPCGVVARRGVTNGGGAARGGTSGVTSGKEEGRRQWGREATCNEGRGGKNELVLGIFFWPRWF